MPRFFVPPSNIHADRFTLTGSEAHHALAVYRQKVGDILDLFDGVDTAFRGKIESVTENTVHGLIVERKSAPLTDMAKIHLYAALIKGPRWDWLVQKASEVGVVTLVPLHTLRTVIQLNSEEGEAKRERWQRIAMEAAKQCGRLQPMRVLAPNPFNQALQQIPAGSLVLMPWEKESTVHIRRACMTYKGRDVLILVGPEGGWDASEVKAARDIGAVTVTLGPNLLRSETAGIVAAALTGEILREDY